MMDRNIDRFMGFITRELGKSTLSARIPQGAHIFHGAYNDSDLTQANLDMATNILLGMTLGYVEDAPLVMIFEYRPNQETLIDLSSEVYRKGAQSLIQSVRKKSQQELSHRIDELVAA
ncbi:MAG: hypothetical protein KBG20_15960 [Caldilineaceae bacterium]|nr:hypothetical protein [Caldilineaceae bacterium]MBP8108702.1 hypothetical protein [Caldilineaceae bacterium]MBP8121043.1 hypothetical protein [Caldilineaceae bacterium]MBP9073803.1 hypothetical protein [Caldilineaceae bacterium]